MRGLALGRAHRRWGRAAVIVVSAAVVAGGMAPTAAADVFVSDARVTEGDAGTANMTFTITADTTTFGTYETRDGTAKSSGNLFSPADYTHTEGEFFIVCSDGCSSEEVVVPVSGDRLDEPDETFSLVATPFDCCEGGDGDFEFRVDDLEGVGTIIDDDDSPYSLPGGGGGPGPGPGPGQTGPGAAEDSDGDGVSNASDACPLVAGSPPSGCPAGGLPPPTFGKTVNLTTLQDDVFIRTPGGSASAHGARAAQKGQGFEPLIEPRQVPVGTFVDTTNGKVRLASARTAAGGIQFARVADGLFQVLQSRRRTRGTTELRLKGSSFRRCGVGARGTQANAAGRRLSRRTIRRLRTSAGGRFRTRGRHSAATVRGTVWITADRCDGTLTRVIRGRVAVRDFRRRRTIGVRSGKSYLAQPPG